MNFTVLNKNKSSRKSTSLLVTSMKLPPMGIWTKLLVLKWLKCQEGGGV